MVDIMGFLIPESNDAQINVQFFSRVEMTPLPRNFTCYGFSAWESVGNQWVSDSLWVSKRKSTILQIHNCRIRGYEIYIVFNARVIQESLKFGKGLVS